MALSPMMQQYFEIKEKYKDYILMYRLGDFYEMFFDDALTASKELELTLTGRDCGEEERAPMCGVPFHKSDVYIGRLVEKGFKVALCEQMEDPATAKGLVKREVVRVITPGTIIENTLLSDNKNNYLGAVFSENIKKIGVAFVDITTGRVCATEYDGEDSVTKLINELGTYAPSELLVSCEREQLPEIERYINEKANAMLSFGEAKRFDAALAKGYSVECFGTDKAEKLCDYSCALCAVGALFSYIIETQKTELSYIKELDFYTDGKYVELDFNTRRNLELAESMRTKDKKGSLLAVIDRTCTAMGARLLRYYLLHPLLDVSEIRMRQAAVTDFYEDFMVREEARALLCSVLDLERLMAKVAYGSANARDLLGIYSSIKIIPELKALLSSLKSNEIVSLVNELDDLSDIASLIFDSISEKAPNTLREGGIIKDGFNADIDYLRSVRDNGREWIAEIEQKEKEATGIKTLRVAYNKVFGYFIEVTKSLVDMVPERYIRKQTLTNCERYITEELKDMESTILGANDKLNGLEYSIFQEIREKIFENTERIFASANALSKIDVYISLADVAKRNNYVMPDIDNSDILDIKGGRHPVVEKFVSDSYFVPNDTYLDTKHDRLMLITGPNMAGKSTYMRQVAIITLMAQIGSYVPASEAHIGICDKIFTRVGASDDLASGQSTFMLEMNEVAYILKNATRRSLIIYDEIGRGTSTYDGMSIARAVAEYTHSDKIGAKTLFATHYHELTVLEDEFDGIVNYNIAAKKRDDSITFLRKIVKGSTDDSYGIEVAKLAGIPSAVIKRAKQILASIESGSADQKASMKKQKDIGEDTFNMLDQMQNSINEEIADRLRSLDINTITPIEAIGILYELKKTLGQ